MTPKKRAKLAKVKAKSFVFDGCHKIFLCADAKDEEHAIKMRGWKRKDFRPFDRKVIEELYDMSCPLKAIWWFNSRRKTVIEQFE